MFLVCSVLTDAAILPAETCPPAVPGESGAAMPDRLLQMLDRVAEAGVEIAVALEDQAKGGRMVVVGDIALAYARVARAVRQTILLRGEITGLIQARRAADAARAADARAGVARILKDVIDSRPEGEEPSERLGREAAERLEREDFTAFLALPFGEAVAAICRDLGLTPDWLALAEECAAFQADLEATYAPAGPEPAKSSERAALRRALDALDDTS